MALVALIMNMIRVNIASATLERELVDSKVCTAITMKTEFGHLSVHQSQEIHLNKKSCQVMEKVLNHLLEVLLRTWNLM